MRSIRLSLAVYFLALLALALAAVSVLAYRNTEHVLGDKEAIRRAMLSGQFDRDRKAEEVKLDRALSWQGNGMLCGSPALLAQIHLDRKSTRLNSSHVKISYA